MSPQTTAATGMDANVRFHRGLPTRSVVWGRGACSQLGSMLQEAGVRRALLLTWPDLTRDTALLRTVEAHLGSLLVDRFDGLDAHVPHAAVRIAAERARAAQADGVVSLGGGSVIDGAKAVVAELAGDGLVVAHVALPTTLSGAEFAHYYGVTDDTADGAQTTKRSFARTDVTPTSVIIDPELTVLTPDPLWAGSGIKALDHAVEGIALGGGRPVADVLALVGIRGLAESLASSREPEALERRVACQLASWQCYVAPASTRLGLSHRIGQVLGGTFGVPHSLTSGITLPPVLRLLADLAPHAIAQVADALDPDGPLDVGGRTASAPEQASERLATFVQRLELPTQLRDVGLSREQAARTAQLVADFYAEEAALAADGLDALVADMW